VLSFLLARIFPTGTARLPRRLIQLFIGLVLFGVSLSFLVLAGLGLDPWDVFHQGLAKHSSLTIGTWSILISGVVLLLWIPLRQAPGLGTVCNAIVVGSVMNVVLATVPAPHQLPLRALTLVAGIVLNGVATGAYIGAGMGPGPRDGLMTGLAKRGLSIRRARTSIEVTVLIAGFFLGGSVGIGTVLYALCIGPLAHVFLPLLTIDVPESADVRDVSTRADLSAGQVSVSPKERPPAAPTTRRGG
jgi:uncharacterized membrane protein YczE